MKVLVAFGTRPEAIKLAPVVRELKSRSGVDVRVATTAQHREMLDQVLDVFEIRPDVDLDIMQPEQSLADLSARVLRAMTELLRLEAPDLLVVQGDTTSAMTCALSAFYQRVPIAHVEAGLRTTAIDEPFPEEMNRRVVSLLASLHFAPTNRARDALVAEGCAPDRVFVTGNPVVDALHYVRATTAFRSTPLPVNVPAGAKLMLVTLHRRESWGEPLEGMCRALRDIVERHRDVHVAFPVHLNPIVRGAVNRVLRDVARVSLLEPLDYVSFVAVMDASWIVLTDSGGVQEEAPALGKPVLVLRNRTERPEAVEYGVARLVGTGFHEIVSATDDLLSTAGARDAMAHAVSPFGDGRAARRIADLITQRIVPSHSASRVNVTPGGIGIHGH